MSFLFPTSFLSIYTINVYKLFRNKCNSFCNSSNKSSRDSIFRETISTTSMVRNISSAPRTTAGGPRPSVYAAGNCAISESTFDRSIDSNIRLIITCILSILYILPILNILLPLFNFLTSEIYKQVEIAPIHEKPRNYINRLNRTVIWLHNFPIERNHRQDRPNNHL